MFFKAFSSHLPHSVEPVLDGEGSKSAAGLEAGEVPEPVCASTEGTDQHQQQHNEREDEEEVEDVVAAPAVTAVADAVASKSPKELRFFVAKLANFHHAVTEDAKQKDHLI